MNNEEQKQEFINKIKGKIHQSGTKHSGYWIWHGKRVNYDQKIYTSFLLEWLEAL